MVKSVLIADDQKIIRRSLCRLFAAQDDFDVCGDAENGLEAIEMAQLLLPDLIFARSFNAGDECVQGSCCSRMRLKNLGRYDSSSVRSQSAFIRPRG